MICHGACENLGGLAFFFSSCRREMVPYPPQKIGAQWALLTRQGLTLTGKILGTEHTMPVQKYTTKHHKNIIILKLFLLFFLLCFSIFFSCCLFCSFLFLFSSFPYSLVHLFKFLIWIYSDIHSCNFFVQIYSDIRSCEKYECHTLVRSASSSSSSSERLMKTKWGKRLLTPLCTHLTLPVLQLTALEMQQTSLHIYHVCTLY